MLDLKKISNWIIKRTPLLWGLLFVAVLASAGAPVKTGQATASLPKGPVLVASQPIYPTPYNPMGLVILTWDAGPDHPNADVWVKYNGSRDRVLLMKQPKGGMQVPVQRGQMYTYVLMDGRTVLGTATFVAY